MLLNILLDVNNSPLKLLSVRNSFKYLYKKKKYFNSTPLG